MSSAFCSESYRCKNKDWCAKDYRPELDGYECLELMTNADRIRAMSDEELARYFSDIGCHKQADREICLAHDKNCEWCWLDWLKQEVSDD